MVPHLHRLHHHHHHHHHDSRPRIYLMKDGEEDDEDGLALFGLAHIPCF
jgi:SAUR family protein